MFISFQVLTTTGWAQFMWEDKRLAWDPTEFGDIDRIRVAASNVSKYFKTTLNT